MCGEDYFHKDWPSSPPTGDGEFDWDKWEQEFLAEFPEDDDDLPDFGDPEEDNDWDEGEWFGDDELYGEVGPMDALEDAIMLMDEATLLEWLLMDETEFTGRSRNSCGESALLDWDEAA